MSTRIAINGFGRIGRLVFAPCTSRGLFGKDVEVVAVGDIVPADNLAYLLKYDSTQQKFAGKVSSKKSGTDKEADDVLGRRRQGDRGRQREVAGRLPWKKLGVDYVIESTGLFTDGEKAKGHLTAGAKKVIISAPAKGEDITVVMGVNHEKYDAASTTSCRTRAARPTASCRSCTCC
jgi:glyceraldehyde 3-phosphate dehydrogenase